MLAMDYCPGGELYQFFKAKKRLTLPEAQFYAANVLLGLERLHDIGIVYRE